MSAKLSVEALRTVKPDRFWALVDRGDDADCWGWTGGTSGKYGLYTIPAPIRRHSTAHRIAWVLAGNDLEPTHEVDHLCRNTFCVNPAHLEAVPQSVNNRRGNSYSAINARKTHCKHGHPFDAANTLIDGRGGRACRACNREKMRRRRAAEREAAA